mgnify:CR=1 FL=1
MPSSSLLSGPSICVRCYMTRTAILFPRIYTKHMTCHNTTTAHTTHSLPRPTLLPLTRLCSCRGCCHTWAPVRRGGWPRSRRVEPGDHHICAADRHDSVRRCRAEQRQLRRVLPAYGGRRAGGCVPRGLHARGRQSSPGTFLLGPLLCDIHCRQCLQSM